MHEFNPEEVFNAIKEHWTKWTTENNIRNPKVVVGISGGIDSTTTAKLFTKIVGKQNVIGVSLPCNGQKDMEDVNSAFWNLDIKRLTIDIGDAYYSIIDQIENNVVDVTNTTKINLPARLRMSALYAVAQSVGGIVINTCNLSEDILGWNTFGGDNIGSYAPIRWLTKTEVRKLAAYLNVPEYLVNKTPIDGLQPKTDEDNFGFTYDEFDDYLRTGNPAFKYVDRVLDMYQKNKFKLDIVDLPGPKFDFPNYVIRRKI